MKRISAFCFSFLLVALSVQGSTGHSGRVDKVQPMFWWAGMQQPELQILLHGAAVGQSEITLSTDEVRISRVVRPANKNYVLLYLNTAGAAPQKFDIILRQDGRKERVPYELRARDGKPRGSWDASDVLYLLMPDRFADGDTTNNSVPGLREQGWSLEHPDARHGGDLKGIRQHLDYLQDLGVTALWLTPILENDMPGYSYHGYAITDYYAIDPRYGSLSDYQAFVADAHRHGLKVIQDMVFNHCGEENFLFTDLPDTTWFNYGSRYVQTTYKTAAIGDLYATDADRRLVQDGWFVRSMPDWNQRNGDVLTYLIQNSIFWIEYAGIDGIRQDTYPYADMAAMAQWCKAVEKEYPGFNIVGETWIGNNVGVSFWQKDSRLAAPLNSELPTVMDFPLMDLLNSALDEETGDWQGGLTRIHDYLQQDRVYADPMHLLTFLENHDTDRFLRTAAQASTDLWRYKQALTLLLTLRGIPQLYYGTEIGMDGVKSAGDGALRKTFPGGFIGDLTDAFTEKGRTLQQRSYHDFTRRLLRWRQGNEAVGRGTFCHFPPRQGVYVYSRQWGSRTVTVLMNGTSRPASVDLSDYASVLPARTALDVEAGRRIELGDHLQLGIREAIILDFSDEIR